MSIAGTLALMSSAIAAKIRDIKSPDVEITRLKAKVDDLTRERDEWREHALGWREQARRLQTPESIQRDMAVQEAHRMMQARAENQRAYAQLQNAQNAQYQQHMAQQQMGLQLSQIDSFLDGDFCNCVPGRHQLLARR